jgi:hypothetical protein
MTGPRVVLHVGAPKSGTTFLQRSLWNRQEALAEVGVRCVGEHARDMFHAAIGVRGSEKFWNMDPEELRRTWERLVQQARSGTGTWVMSHEILAASSRTRAERALADLEGMDVHLVYTARDLGRQVPSDWQERVKNGSTVSYGEFQEDIRQRLLTGRASGAFWRAQDVVDVLDRWGSSLPPDRVHVVTAPQRGAPPALLWERFGAAVGFDGQVITPDAGSRSNQTLGSVQAELLRRVNEHLGDRVPQPHYAKLVKRQFSQGTLTQQSSPPARCSPDLLAQLRTFALRANEQLLARGYQVHGDLADLVPAADGGETVDPSALSPEQLVEAATAALADVLAARVPSRPAKRAGAPAGQAPPPPGLRSLSARASALVRRARTRVRG